MHPEGGANGGAAVAERVPRDADARFREEFGAVCGEGCGADGGIGVDNAVGETVVGGTASDFVEAVRGFEADSAAEFEPGSELERVFEVGCAEEGAPAKFGRIRDYGEGRDIPGEEAGKSGEGRLAELILRSGVVGLQPP